MNYTVVVLGGTFALALAYYYFPVYGGVHWFTGPHRTLERSLNGSSSAVPEKRSESVTNEKSEAISISEEPSKN